MQEEIFFLEQEVDKLLSDEQLNAPGPSKALLSAAAKWSEAVWKTAEQPGGLSFTANEMRQALQFGKKAIFVCGVHRSGTTLLRDLLDEHPSLSVLPSEGAFITNQEEQLLRLPPGTRCGFLCKEWLWRLANPINQPPYWLLGRSSKQDSPYLYFARAFITWWNFFASDASNKNNMWPLVVIQLSYAFARNKFEENQTACCWVDKTPANERYLKRLWQQFPEAKILHMIRNPADVLASRIKIEPGTPVRVFLRDLRMSFKVACEQQNKNENRYLLIKYENLCKHPLATAQYIATFLGIEPLPCLTSPTVAGKPAYANSSFKTNAEYGKILSADEQRHEKIITAKELELLSAAVGGSAVKLGYSLPPIGALKGFFLRSMNRIR